MNNYINIEDDFAYLQSLAGDDILINGKGFYKAIINYLKYSKERTEDIRTIASTTELKRGDIITWDNEQWLIISEIGHKRFCYYKGIIQKINYNIKFIFEDGIIREYPAIIESKIFDVESNKFINIPTGKIIVLLQDSTESRMINIDNRFIKMNKAFKVVGDDRTDKGLIKLYCDLDMFSVDDDKINEVANYETYKHTFTIDILNGNPLTVNILTISEFDILTSCTDNGEVVTPDDIEYIVSDPLVGRMEGNKFICIGTGTTTLTASWNGASASITIIVILEEVHNYAVTMTGDNFINRSQTKTYTALFTDNGSPTTKYAQWVLTDDYGNPTSYATIQSQTDSTCTVKADKTVGVYVNLTVAANDASCQATKRILIKSLV